MPDMPDAPDWAARLTQSVAQEVRRNRERRGMSAQQLSDACGKLGLPIHRAVISNFENGRRGLGIGELMVIAKALDVAPIFLLFPVGFVESIEVLPGEKVTPVEALRWFAADHERRSFVRENRSLQTMIPFALVMNETALVRGFTWNVVHEIHIPEKANAYLDSEMLTSRESLAASAEARRLRERLNRIERGEEDVSLEELSVLRRDREAAQQRARRAADDYFRADELARAVQYWVSEGGLEGHVEEISAIRREMARRGMVRDPLPAEIAEFFDEDVR